MDVGLCCLPIHKICALCGIFIVISVLLTTENSDNLEILVLDGSRSLKVTPVNLSCYFLLVINCSRWRDSPGTISIKFCTEVRI